MNKNPFPIFAILTMVGTGIAMLQMSVKDTSLIIKIMLAGIGDGCCQNNIGKLTLLPM
jgi:hypothetical protein